MLKGLNFEVVLERSAFFFFFFRQDLISGS